MRWLAADTDLWTPVEYGRSRPTVKRSELAGWVKQGFCRSHSRWFWGLRLLMAICDHYLTECGVRLIRPSYRNRKPASPDASWHLPPPSGTTAPPAGPSPDP